MNQKRYLIFDYFLLLLITLITYWPVSLCVFSLKHDSLVQYLPYRYHLSEAIQHHFFPFWSPFLYTGFPIHADMQGMTWNPIVLTLSLISTYNMSLLQIEVSIYLFLCFAGTYFLLKTYHYSRLTCLIGAVSYGCCGYITDSASVIPWISSAAFIPFTFASLHLLLQKPTLLRSLLFGLCLSLFFVCSYPGLFIYTAYLLAAILLVSAISFLRTKQFKKLKTVCLLLIVATIIFLLLCSPAVLSYWEFLPYYTRGSAISYSKATTNLFPPFASLSFLIPNAVSKPHSWLFTDTSMRNTYVGIFIFVSFLYSLIHFRVSLKLILGIAIFSFLFSLGELTPLHRWCYEWLPMMNTFRHPATIRLFTSLGIILLASEGIDKFFSKEVKHSSNKTKYLFFFLTGMGLISCMYYGATGNIGGVIQAALSKSSPKEKLEALTFEHIAFGESLLQLVFLAILGVLVQQKKRNLLLFLFLVNSILFAWVAQPFTFISQVKTAVINHYLDSFPKGYPKLPFEHTIEANRSSDSVGVSPYGYQNFYTKKITIQDHIINPTLNTDYTLFLTNALLRKTFNSYPVVYLADTVIHDWQMMSQESQQKIVYLPDKHLSVLHSSSADIVTLKEYGPNHFAFDVFSERGSILSFFQQYHPSWKASINSNRSAILKSNIAFMSVSVPAGRSKVKFVYEPTTVLLAMKISIITLSILVISIIFLAIKKKDQ